MQSVRYAVEKIVEELKLATDTEEKIMSDWLQAYNRRPPAERNEEDDEMAERFRLFLQQKRRPTTHDGSEEARQKFFGFPWWTPNELSNFVATGNGYITCPTQEMTKLVAALPDIYAELERLYERHGTLSTGQLLVRSGYLTQDEANLDDDEMDK